jgi:hypothetical protein
MDVRTRAEELTLSTYDAHEGFPTRGSPRVITWTFHPFVSFHTVPCIILMPVNERQVMKGAIQQSQQELHPENVLQPQSGCTDLAPDNPPPDQYPYLEIHWQGFQIPGEAMKKLVRSTSWLGIGGSNGAAVAVR